MPSRESATRVTWRPKLSSPWKYITMRRFASSTWTSGEAMCGAVNSLSMECGSWLPPYVAARRALALSSASGSTGGGSLGKWESPICRLPGGCTFHGPSRLSA